jgi:protein Mpv17
MAAALTIARAYQHSFESHPNTTLAITGGCLNTLGDFVAQASQNTVRPGLCFYCVFIDVLLVEERT